MELKTFYQQLYQSHQACPLCPSPQDVANFYTRLLGTLFAEFTQLTFVSAEAFEEHMGDIHRELEGIIENNPEQRGVHAKQITDAFFEKLPSLHAQINRDVQAMYSGDPAAKSRSEVIRTYPGFYAIASYRIAHALHVLTVAGIPRIITEHAHSKTGIDIHPAAIIGDDFCIDHGTGVVIGETAVIGNQVKIYQGVTLGALSVNKADAEKKRHPTIGDRVVIYSGATILGGETEIGHDSIIGGNVWLTRSVPPHSKVYYQARMQHDDNPETDLVIFKTNMQ